MTKTEVCRVFSHSVSVHNTSLQPTYVGTVDAEIRNGRRNEQQTRKRATGAARGSMQEAVAGTISPKDNSSRTVATAVSTRTTLNQMERRTTSQSGRPGTPHMCSNKSRIGPKQAAQNSRGRGG